MIQKKILQKKRQNSYIIKEKKEANCKCGNNVFLGFCSEEKLLSGCINVDSNNKSILLTENSEECETVIELIKVKNSSLVDIFDLNTGTIHSTSIRIIINNIVTIAFCFFALYAYRFCDDQKKDKEDCCDCIFEYLCTIFILLIILICLILNIIDFSILCGAYNSDDTRKFLNFLECKNVNKESFSKYAILEDLSYNFTLIKIFHSLFIIYIVVFTFLLLMFKCLYQEKYLHKEEKENQIENKDDKKIELNY